MSSEAIFQKSYWMFFKKKDDSCEVKATWKSKYKEKVFEYGVKFGSCASDLFELCE